jgi:hypothetical protein
MDKKRIVLTAMICICWFLDIINLIIYGYTSMSFKHYITIITLLPFFIELLQYDWLCSGHMIIKEMFYIPIQPKPELARASMTTSDVSNQWRSNFLRQII